MPPKLTRRQQEFLSRFIDLYREAQEPIHYAEVARRLGVGKVTAYEMLRLLEERGLVSSSFYLPPEKHGPGRATVRFAPTGEAHRLLLRLAGPEGRPEDWEAFKAGILARLRQGRVEGYEPLLSELLARLPERRSPLRYTAELITAMLLALRTLLEGAHGRELRTRLQRIGMPGELGLSALSGLALALDLAERLNRRFSTALLAEINRYQHTVQTLSEDNRQRLAAFVREVAACLFAGPEEKPGKTHPPA